MVFSSVTFIFVFLPVTLILYYLLRGKARNVWLLITSLFFYAFGGISFLPIMLASIVINYLGGLSMLKFTAEKPRKIALSLFVLANVFLLGYWKYFNFFTDVAEKITGKSFNLQPVLLPIGISFFTFQGMSYVIDCYRKKVTPNKSFLTVALYISMFPQLIAGPIVRYEDICNQLESRQFTVDDIASGLRKFTVGLAKKAVLANSFGVVADQIFNIQPDEHRVIVAWLGIISYSLQLYYDFAGYSDMAIGLGRMMGFTFPENFNYPFISKSYRELWTRWHMTLGTWFREYVYIPLGGSRVSTLRGFFNIFVVSFLTGFWHGADYTYVVWGLSMAIINCIEKATNFPKKLGKFGHIYTLLIWHLTLVVFRSPSITYAAGYIRSLFGLLKISRVGFEPSWYFDRYYVFMLVVGILCSTPLVKNLWIKASGKLSLSSKDLCANVIALVLFAISCMYIMTSTYNPFIYFQF